MPQGAFGAAAAHAGVGGALQPTTNVVGSSFTRMLPNKNQVFYDSINVDNPKKKLLEFNEECKVLTEADLGLLESLLNLIKERSSYHSSKISKPGFDMIAKFFKFPIDK